MASLSTRSSLILCRHLAAHRTIFAERSIGPASFFTTSIMRLWKPQTPSKVLKFAKSTISKPLPAPKPPAATVAPSRYAFIKSLTSKQTPTTLYEGPSHFWFYFGCWSSGITILGWAILTGPTVIQQPDDVPHWVGVVFGGCYMLLVAMGFYIISKTPNIISSIRILPPNFTTPSKITAIAASTTAQPQLEVAVKRMLPFLKPYVIKTNLDNVSLKSRFSLPEEYVPELKRLRLKLKIEEQRKALHIFDMQHLLTMPFRKVGRAISNMFRGVRSAWTDMGFGVIKVDGKCYKVDVTKGFAHDGFKTLEMVVQVGFK